jgi:hypothetical protein
MLCNIITSHGILYTHCFFCWESDQSNFHQCPMEGTFRFEKWLCNWNGFQCVWICVLHSLSPVAPTYITSFMKTGTGIQEISRKFERLHEMLVLLMWGTGYEACCEDGLGWYYEDMSNVDQFRHLSDIGVIVSTMSEVSVLVLIIRGTHDASCWDGLRWQDLLTKFDYNQFRHSNSTRI